MYSEAIVTLLGEGSKLYALKEYEAAASHYAEACKLFSEENDHDDANLLLLYGKALFQNGVAHSGVLGGVSQAEQPGRDQEEHEEDDDFQFEEGMAAGENDVAEEDEGDSDESGGESKSSADAEEDAERDAGDEDDAGDEKNEGDDGDEGDAEDQSDFEAAWDILDIARALLEQRKQELEKDVTGLESPYMLSTNAKAHTEFVDTLEKLHETYDLLGEVSLESENFPQAARDLKSCLEIRKSLYPLDTSSLVSESHYKLSLALEFCVEDPNLRKEAAYHMQAAIQNVENRMALETDPQKKKEDQDLLVDLEERYSELQRNPSEELESEQMQMIKGLLGEAVASATGVPANSGDKRKAPVNDLSAMVVKKKRPAPKK